MNNFINFIRKNWILLLSVIGIVFILVFPKIFLLIGIIILITLLLVVAFLYARRSDKPDKPENGKRTNWPLPNGWQIPIFVIISSLFLILYNKQRFITEIWSGPTGRFCFLALILMAISTAVLPLGRIVKPEPFAKIRDWVIVITLIICLSLLIGADKPVNEAWGWIKTDGWERVKDVFDKDTEPETVAQSRAFTQQSTPSVVYHDTLAVDGQWQILSTVPQLGYRYQFDLPNNDAKIEWRHKNNHQTKKVLKNLNLYSAINIKSTNPYSIPVEIRTKSGKKLKIPVTVTEA